MSEVNKAQVKKAKAAALKVSKKFQLNDAANAALEEVDTLVQAGEFAKALEAVAAATAAINLCPPKGAKVKSKEHGDGDDAAASGGGGGGGGGAAEEPVPEVEQPAAVESIDAISAEGVALGLSGAELVKFALRRLGAGTAVVQAEAAMAGRTSDVATHYRTNNCVELRTGDIGKSVALVGWVAKTRFVGQMLGFVDLRDRYGVTQVGRSVGQSVGLGQSAAMGRSNIWPVGVVARFVSAKFAGIVTVLCVACVACGGRACARHTQVGMTRVPPLDDCSHHSRAPP
jgi:hypothetical protein